MGKTVWIQVEKSHQIGTGHWYRCQALAEELRRCRIEVVWTKTTETRAVVTDLSHEDNIKNLKRHVEYLRRLKGMGLKLVMIDGFDDDSVSQKIMVPADVLVVPYVGAEKRKYKVRPQTKLLLGPAYAILRKAFIQAQPRKYRGKNLKNILVVLSGSHQPELLNQVTKALAWLKWPKQQIKVVPGGKQISAKKMVELMDWADLGILGPGLIRYEAAAIGLPYIVPGENKPKEEIINVDGKGAVRVAEVIWQMIK